MRRIMLIAVGILLMTSSVSYADKDDYAKLVWEGLVKNSSYFGENMVVRITFDGVIGEQLPNGQVKVYDKIIKDYYGTGDVRIFPMIEGGTVTLEYLEDAKDTTYQETELTLGMSYSNKLKPNKDKSSYTIETNGIYSTDKVFTDDNFNFDPRPENKKITTSIRAVDSNEKYVALIYMPLSSMDLWGQYFMQGVTETEAKQMMTEIKNGHHTIKVGKLLNDKTVEKQPESTHLAVEYPIIKKEDLESKYGITIHAEKGFWPVEDLLSMLDTTYSKFPKGLIKEVSEYYKKNGRGIVVNFQYKQTPLGGSFSDAYSTMYLNYYPNSVNDSFDHWTLAHEMGHLIHKYINDRYGYEKFKKVWCTFNGSFDYYDDWTSNWGKEGHDLTFVRNYSLKNYSEDVATTFELLAGRNPTDLRNRMMTTDDFPLKEKMDFLTLILDQLSESVTLDNQWNRVYPEQPSSIYENVIELAKKSQLIPNSSSFNGLYQSSITRRDMADLVNWFLKETTKESIAEIAARKGVKEEWYYVGSIASDGSSKLNTNYPFLDSMNYEAFDLYTLGALKVESQGRFNPEGLITREDAAFMIYKIAMILDRTPKKYDEEFSDVALINEWNVEGVQYVLAENIMWLDENKMFNPKGNISYEEAYGMMYRLK